MASYTSYKWLFCMTQVFKYLKGCILLRHTASYINLQSYKKSEKKESAYLPDYLLYI